MEESETSSLSINSEGSSTPLTPSTPLALTPGPEDLEDRYNKLKTIAVKLKRKIKEQNEEISELEKEKSKFQNASKIQLEFDKAQDEVERLRREKKVLEKDLQSAVEENIKLKMQTMDDSGKLQSLTTSHKVLREKVEKMEKEVGDLEQFKLKADTLEAELTERKVAELSADKEKKQSAILSLEITDYEKKLQDANKQLEEKKAEVEALRKDLSKRSETIDDNEKNLTIFKDKEEVLTRAKESLQADIQRKLEKIQFLQDEMNKIKEKASEKNLEYLKLEQEYENSKLGFSSQSKELVERCDGLQRMIATLEHKISVLEENKRSRESHIGNLKLELQQLESEYSNYKTKAQTMLKSQKPIVVERESDELENLQKIVQNFQSDISILKTDLQTLKMENDNLQLEKSELTLRLNQSKTDSLEKDIRLNNELQRLKQEVRQKEDLHFIEVDNLRKSNAQALSVLEGKMASVKEKYEEQLLHIQEQMDSITYEVKENGVKIEQIPSHSSAFRPIVPGPPTNLSDPESEVFSHSQPLAIDTGLGFEQFKMIPRGECEGSESVGSAFTPRPSVETYLSFEQLLSTDGRDSDLEKRSKDAINFKEELVRSQNQVGHLTALLRESESNCERLTQLSDALKEEIRRVEREKGRQEHLKENTEYLKNILLKFMTLNGEDERHRLIPVMKTMLQLTNEEVGRLENTIKGKDGSAHSREGTWSSYLPLWGAEK